MALARVARLREAFSCAIIARFWNPYDSSWTHGYVLDIGPRFFLLGLIDDNVMFNGFACFLVSDVRRLQVPDPYEEFVVAALRKRGQSIDSKPDIDLSNLPAILKSASRLFALITIYREREKPGVCLIGKVVHVTGNYLFLHEINADAVWEGKSSKIRLSEITRVDFGGGYEEALHLVGGAPKELKLSPKRKRP